MRSTEKKNLEGTVLAVLASQGSPYRQLSSSRGMRGDLIVLILSNGMSFADLDAVIEVR